jgi:hypothetical protein
MEASLFGQTQETAQSTVTAGSSAAVVRGLRGRPLGTFSSPGSSATSIVAVTTAREPAAR